LLGNPVIRQETSMKNLLGRCTIALMLAGAMLMPAMANGPLMLAADTPSAGGASSSTSSPGPRPFSGFRTGPASCEVDAFTKVQVGQVHTWCPGVQTAGGGCSAPVMCKRCDAAGSWGQEYRC
jgi:hypothetical protein